MGGQGPLADLGGGSGCWGCSTAHPHRARPVLVLDGLDPENDGSTEELWLRDKMPESKENAVMLKRRRRLSVPRG